MELVIERIVVGMFEENCYLAYEQGNNNDNTKRNAMLIDPGDEDERIIEMIEEKNLSLEAILLTHAHFDHIGAVNKIAEKYKPKIYLNENDFELYYCIDKQSSYFHVPDFKVPKITNKSIENIAIPVLNFKMNVIHTPGHTKGSVCYYSPLHKIMFTGDTIFKGSIGRVDFPTGNAEEMERSLDRLTTLPNDIVIYPGHMDKSTIGHEKEYNPFLN